MLEAINKVRELQGEHGALRKRELLRKYKDDDNFASFYTMPLTLCSPTKFRKAHCAVEHSMTQR